MKVVPAIFPGLWVDSVQALTKETAAGLKADSIAGSIRYLGSLTQTERDIILTAGLGLDVVTYSRSPGWAPSPGLGQSDGVTDLHHLSDAGIPTGVTVWIDLEGCHGDEKGAADWVDERSGVLANAGYEVGVYVGYDQPLDGGLLYALPQVTRYWKSLSKVPEPTCGWSLIQLYKSVTIAGVWVDVDVIQYDYQSRVPTVLVA
jgi:hypothetical protein